MLLNCLKNFKLTHQICCEIMLVAAVHMFITLCFIAMAISLVFLHVYKDTTSHLDSQQFEEMTNIGNLFENSQLMLESSYKDYSKLLAIMYKVISEKKIGNITAESKLNVIAYSSSTPDIDANKTILHWSKSPMPINDTTKEILEDMSIYLSQIHNQKIYGYKDYDNQYYNQIFFIDVKNNFLCAYPGDLSNFNKNIAFENIKTYIKDKLLSKVNIISSLSQIFSNNLFFENLYELPIFEESTPFPELYLSKDTIKILSFAIIKDDYNISSTQFDFSKVFIVIGKTNPINFIYDSIIETPDNIQLLKTKYYFPYELMNKELCLYIRNINLNDQDSDLIQLSQTNLDNANHLEDCFSNSTDNAYEIDNNNMTYRNLFFYALKLFDRSIPFQHSNLNSTELIQLYETKLFQSNSTAFNQTINNRLTINNKVYKVQKRYIPFALPNLINYYYPICNIYLNIIIKNEGVNDNITSDIRNSILAILINCIIWSYVLMAIILLYIGIRLNKVTKSIQRTIDQINNLISGNPCKESTHENIHEFNTLIKLIEEMIKRDLDLNQTQNQKEEIRFQFDLERFNMEFKFVDSNIVVKEDDILNLIENNNESFAILNKSIDRMRADTFAKRSDIFKDIVDKMIDTNDNTSESESKNKGVKDREKENEDDSIDEFLLSNRSLQYSRNALYKEGLDVKMEIEETCLFFK